MIIISFVENIKDSLKILTFNEESLQKVTDNEKATGYGFLTLAIAGIALAIATLSPLGIILKPIGMIIGFVITYSLFHFIAKFILGGQATGTQYFRTLSNSCVIYWFTFIPIIGAFLQFAAGVWLIIINIFILHKVHKLSMVKAVILGLLPMLIIFGIILLGLAAYLTVLDPVIVTG